MKRTAPPESAAKKAKVARRAGKASVAAAAAAENVADDAAQEMRVLLGQNRSMARALFGFERERRALRRTHDAAESAARRYESTVGCVERHWAQLEADLRAVLARLGESSSEGEEAAGSALQALARAGAPLAVEVALERDTGYIVEGGAVVSADTEGEEKTDQPEQKKQEQQQQEEEARQVDEKLRERCAFTTALLERVVAALGSGAGAESGTALQAQLREAQSRLRTAQGRLAEQQRTVDEQRLHLAAAVRERRAALRQLDALRLRAGESFADALPAVAGDAPPPPAAAAAPAPAAAAPAAAAAAPAPAADDPPPDSNNDELVQQLQADAADQKRLAERHGEEVASLSASLGEARRELVLAQQQALAPPAAVVQQSPVFAHMAETAAAEARRRGEAEVLLAQQMRDANQLGLQVSTLERALNSVNDERVGDLRQQVSRLQTRVGELTAESADAARLQAEAARLRAEGEALAAQVARLEEQRALLEAEAAKARAAREGGDDDLLGEIDELAKGKAALQQQVDQTQADLAESRANFARKSTDFVKVRRAAEVERGALAARTAELAALKEQVAALAQAAAAADELQAQGAAEAEQLRRDITRHKGEYESQRQLAADAATELAAAKASHAQLQAQLDAAQRRAAEAEAAVETKDNQLKRVRGEVEAQRRKVSKLRRSSSSSGGGGSGSAGADDTTLALLNKMCLCSVCNVNYKNAMITRCGHSACDDCLQQRIKDRMRRCPSCNQTFAKDDVVALYLT